MVTNDITFRQKIRYSAIEQFGKLRVRVTISSNFLSIGGRICSVGNTYRPIHDITHSEHKLYMYSIENNRRDFSELRTFLFTVI